MQETDTISAPSPTKASFLTGKTSLLSGKTSFLSDKNKGDHSDNPIPDTLVERLDAPIPSSFMPAIKSTGRSIHSQFIFNEGELVSPSLIPHI